MHVCPAGAGEQLVQPGPPLLLQLCWLDRAPVLTPLCWYDQATFADGEQFLWNKVRTAIVPS